MKTEMKKENLPLMLVEKHNIVTPQHQQMFHCLKQKQKKLNKKHLNTLII